MPKVRHYMGFIRHKKINNKIYAYEINSYWDSKKKKPRQRSKYLGVVDANGEIKKRKDQELQETLILDFGDGYLVNEFFKTISIYKIIEDSFVENYSEIIVLIIYKLITQSAMYNGELWLESNILSKLYPNVDLSSQNTSRILSKLGEEHNQQFFFKQYIKKLGGIQKSVIIDSTALPNQMHSEFNAWGHCDGGIEKQVRLLCVLDHATKIPLYYRYLPGNIVDVSTLQTTIAELQAIGVESSFVLIDAGYFSKTNVQELYKNKINFMSRLPASRALFKEILNKSGLPIDVVDNAIHFGNRALFVKEHKITLYGQNGYAYVVLDPVRRGKEMNDVLIDHFNNDKVEPIAEEKLRDCGIMILISSQKINREEAVDLYYTRQSVERVFGFYKDDLNSLPVRRHNETTLRGYLFLQFLTLILFIKFREKLMKNHTVEQALLRMRALKCKVYSAKILISEETKQQRDISKLLNVIMPKFLGI
jgi:transposase